MIAHVFTAAGTVAVDTEDDLVLGEPLEPAAPEPAPKLGLPRVVAAAASGATVVAVHPDDPDRILYGGRNRLFVSTDGSRFWRALELELPDVQALAWA